MNHQSSKAQTLKTPLRLESLPLWLFGVYCPYNSSVQAIGQPCHLLIFRLPFVTLIVAVLGAFKVTVTHIEALIALSLETAFSGRHGALPVWPRPAPSAFAQAEHWRRSFASDSKKAKARLSRVSLRCVIFF